MASSLLSSLRAGDHHAVVTWFTTHGPKPPQEPIQEAHLWYLKHPEECEAGFRVLLAFAGVQAGNPIRLDDGDGGGPYCHPLVIAVRHANETAFAQLLDRPDVGLSHKVHPHGCACYLSRPDACPGTSLVTESDYIAHGGKNCSTMGFFLMEGLVTADGPKALLPPTCPKKVRTRMAVVMISHLAIYAMDSSFRDGIQVVFPKWFLLECERQGEKDEDYMTAVMGALFRKMATMNQLTGNHFSMVATLVAHRLFTPGMAEILFPLLPESYMGVVNDVRTSFLGSMIFNKSLEHFKAMVSHPYLSPSKVIEVLMDKLTPSALGATPPWAMDRRKFRCAMVLFFLAEEVVKRPEWQDDQHLIGILFTLTFTPQGTDHSLYPLEPFPETSQEPMPAQYLIVPLGRAHDLVKPYWKPKEWSCDTKRMSRGAYKTLEGFPHPSNIVLNQGQLFMLPGSQEAAAKYFGSECPDLDPNYDISTGEPTSSYMIMGHRAYTTTPDAVTRYMSLHPRIRRARMKNMSSKETSILIEFMSIPFLQERMARDAASVTVVSERVASPGPHGVIITLSSLYNYFMDRAEYFGDGGVLAELTKKKVAALGALAPSEWLEFLQSLRAKGVNQGGAEASAAARSKIYCGLRSTWFPRRMAAEYYTLMVLLADGCLKPPHPKGYIRKVTPKEQLDRIERFFGITGRLPLELQMVMTHFAVAINKPNKDEATVTTGPLVIRGAELEAACGSLERSASYLDLEAPKMGRGWGYSSRLEELESDSDKQPTMIGVFGGKKKKTTGEDNASAGNAGSNQDEPVKKEKSPPWWMDEGPPQHMISSDSEEEDSEDEDDE